VLSLTEIAVLAFAFGIALTVMVFWLITLSRRVSDLERRLYGASDSKEISTR